jgi:hypothetical protein
LIRRRAQSPFGEVATSWRLAVIERRSLHKRRVDLTAFHDPPRKFEIKTDNVDVSRENGVITS